MKHVTMIKVIRDGKQSWRLLGPDGKPMQAFDVYAKSLLKQSVNTRRTYCRSVAEFFDYLFEAGDRLAEVRPDFSPTRLQLAEIFEAYDSYLTEGTDSGNEIAKLVAKSLPPPKKYSGETSAVKHAALRGFLHLSEKIRQQLEQLNNAGFETPAPDELPLFPSLGEKRRLSHYESNAMRANSMLSGVISGGPKLIQSVVLRGGRAPKSYDHKRAFPFDRVAEFLDSFYTYRDKALYAFCAASGCRVSEALQLLWSDIDIQNSEVILVDPNSRKNNKSYMALSPAERDQLVWKGRETEATLLIEPFRHLFFTYLLQYLKHEYVPHGRHEFVFQYTESGVEGKPYFLSDPGSRSDVFKGALDRAGIDLVIGVGPHALRHMYGTYLLNYFPRIDGGYGLSMGIVQKIMGHRSIGSTERYARYDQDIIKAELIFANKMVFGTTESKTQHQLKKEVLLRQLRLIEAEEMACR